MGAEFINVDLVLKGTTDLRPLVKALTSAGLHALGEVTATDGIWTATLEGPLGNPTMPEAVAVLLNAVENLGTEQRQAWQQCIERRFDFGFECSDEAFESSYSIAPAVLSRISGIGATLVVTVYSV